MLIRVGNTTVQYPGVGLVAIGAGSSGTGSGGSSGSGSNGPLSIVARAAPLLASDGFVSPAAWCLASGGQAPYTYAFQVNGAAAAGQGFGSYYYLFANQASGLITYNGSYPSTAVAGNTDTLNIMVTDGAGNVATCNLPITYGPANATLIRLSSDFFFTNQPTPNTQFLQINVLLGTEFTSAATISGNDPSGYFNVEAVTSGPGYIIPKSATTWPPAGVYPITMTLTQGGNTYTTVLNAYVVAETGTPSITWTPASSISTSLPAGYVIGQAVCGADADNSYAWTVSPTATFAVSQHGVVTVVNTPTSPGSVPMTLTVTDGDQSYSQTFPVAFVQGNVIPSSHMTAAIPTNLNNAMNSGILTTPTVTGFTPTQWVLAGPYGVGTRYSMATNGQVSIIGPLSYQVAADGTAFEDALTLIATDGVNTCSLTVLVPVAAVTGPTITIGPPAVLAAAGVTGTQYPTFTAAFNALGGVRNPTGVVAGTVFIVYASPDRTYYTNDGQNDSSNNGLGANVGNYVPCTIMGALGTTFPYFTGGSAGKGQLGATAFDITFKNLEVGFCHLDGGNIAAIYKEAGNTTGNLTIDNCYLHDCDNGVFNGCVGGKIFITNTRISHCGVGNEGYTHNVYVNADLVYAKNLLSDSSMCGHLFKTRCQNTIIENCRFIDGNLGSASNIVDIPMGGMSQVIGCLLHKGPNGQNPYMLKFADPNDQGNFEGTNAAGKHNVLTLTGSTLLLDPGKPYPELQLPGGASSCASQAVVFGAVNSSFPGAADGLPAVMNATNNSFYGLLTSNQTVVFNSAYGVTVPVGTNNVSGSVTLTTAQRPALDYSFPGPGPDPTIANPPGPFLNTWFGGEGGGQVTGPVGLMSLPVGTAPGGVAGTVTWAQGNTLVATPVFSLYYQEGPNAWAINAATGVITNTATVVADTTQLDLVVVQIAGGGQTYLWSLAIKAA